MADAARIFVDPRVVFAAAVAGSLAGLALGSAAMTLVRAADAGAGPPLALRGEITALPPALRPALAPDLRLALLSFARPRSAVVGHAGAVAGRDLQCLTDAVYYEARGEPAEGQAAVAQVVLNRTHAAGFPKSVCGVVFQRAGPSCQFSFACNGAVTSRREGAAWLRSRQVAARALEGYRVAQVGRATHFHVAGLQAGWGGGLAQVARIGAHVFYSLGGRHHAAASSAPADTTPGEGVQPVALAPAAAPPTAQPS